MQLITTTPSLKAIYKHLYLNNNMLRITLKLLFIPLISISLMVNAAPACHDLLKAGNPKQAIETADANLKSNPNQIDVWQCKGRAHGLLGQYPAGLNALEQAKMLAKQRQDIMITHMFMGNLHHANQSNAEALQNYELALGIAKAENNRQFTRMNYNLIGDVYTSTQNHTQAMQSYEAASQLSLNDNERAESYAKIAATHQRLNQLNQAIEYQLKTVVMQQKAGTLDDYAEANLLLSQYFTQNKEFASAEKTLQKLLQFSKDNGGDYYEAKSNIYLAQTKLAQADKVSAQSCLQSAKAMATKLNASDIDQLITETEKQL
jgi:tetratricopeptide (TPR) repeat protein